MTGFRGSDEELDREIAALEGIVRVRLKRTVREFAELDRDLKGLVRERTRRRATSAGESSESAPVDAVGDAAAV
jgi:hypothetical protein